MAKTVRAENAVQQKYAKSSFVPNMCALLVKDKITNKAKNASARVFQNNTTGLPATFYHITSVSFLMAMGIDMLIH